MDDADRAQEIIDIGIAESIARVAKANGRSAHFCIDCDTRIPEARRIAYPGCLRCVECQQDIEGKR